MLYKLEALEVKLFAQVVSFQNIYLAKKRKGEKTSLPLLIHPFSPELSEEIF